MGRSRSRQTKPTRPKVSGGGKWHSPREQYVYGIESLTLEELAEVWKGSGIRGCGYQMLRKRSSKENWSRKRVNYQERMRDQTEKNYLSRQSETRARMIEEANARHVQAGRVMMGMGGEYVAKAKKMLDDKDKLEKATPGDFGRTAARLIKDGVTVERLGLELVDRIVHVRIVEEITQEVLLVIAKYVSDPTVYENITDDLKRLGESERKQLNELISEREM